MKSYLVTASIIAITAGGAHAGAIERTTQSVAILFEEGRYVELSLGHVSPDVSGSIPGTNFETRGNVLDSYTTGAVAFKMPVTPEIDVAFVMDQPIGANVAYPDAFYPIAGTTADVDSTGFTVMARYKLPTNFSLIGGVRVLQTSGDVDIRYLGQPISYQMSTSTETDWGYLLGVAYERPDIALRVALTYNSKIDHNFAATERITPIGVYDTDFTTTIPQSVNLEFQTGIMEDTLLFGSVRWVDWSEFDIDPVAYRTANPANRSGSKLVGYERDYTTYTLGLGRKFDENWSGAVTAAYEKRAQNYTSNLGPTDGYFAIGVAVSYEQGPYEITGAIRYYDFHSVTSERLYASFEDNSAIAVGLRLGYRF